MIPKMIHYCWFGRNPLPQKVLDYIQTWRKFFPDFDIKEWNEDNFDVNMMDYTKEAYFAKKYAFVSDVARLHALVSEGGIYFDTDVLVKKRFTDSLLCCSGFIGFEDNSNVGTCVIASEPKNKLLSNILASYETGHFFINLKYDLRTNVQRFSFYFKKEGCVFGGVQQYIGGMIILPPVYLCAKDFLTGRRYDTDETFTIHNFMNTWGGEKSPMEICHKIHVRLIQCMTILRYKMKL